MGMRGVRDVSMSSNPIFTANLGELHKVERFP
jgi:hypothetical protein